MQKKSTGWGWPLLLTHWLSAVALIGLFALGWWMVDLTYYSDWYKTAPHIHKSVGILLALLTLARIGWRISRGRPEAIGKAWEIRLSHFVHILIYLLLITIFTSGYLISTADGSAIDVFNWFSVPGLGEFVENQEDLAGEFHEYLAYGLMGLVLLHTAGALKHHFLDKDKTLIRMLKPKER
ncbi:cytochrome b/b6 domain-containing protein [Bowmanella dokdonensis]|uniref:Cytochrome b n=1 Tax=Bowmanella dokdonensis TaxID=751969 RepID=A0A939IQT6_9ALTE|nr:cytochrome b [Bowmanella dokdonensis]